MNQSQISHRPDRPPARIAQASGRMLHAEALALRICADAGTIERLYTAVVTLDPCNHHGRIPDRVTIRRSAETSSDIIGKAEDVFRHH